MMKLDVLIVEDELMTRNFLINTLVRLYPEINVVGKTGSVEDTVNWLENPANKADIIFMDVELADGNCFEIFRRTQINSCVIMTTAYDNYAIRAFDVESVDYILKPIEPENLKRAVERAKARIAASSKSGGYPAAREADRPFRERFLVKINDMIVPVRTSDIAYFYSEDKCTYLVTADGHKYVVDFSLDIAMEQLDSAGFFRISRQCIIAMSAISSIQKTGSRFLVSATPEAPFEMMVSRSRTDDFLHWLEGAGS